MLAKRYVLELTRRKRGDLVALEQRVGETRMPVPAAPGRPARVDDEYERKGTENSSMFVEPLRARGTQLTGHRARTDWALAYPEFKS